VNSSTLRTPKGRALIQGARIVRIMAENVAKKLDLSRKRLLTAAGLIAIVIPIIFGLVNETQSLAELQAGDAADKIPAFEVFSVKPNRSGSGSFRVNLPDDGYSATNIPLKLLVASAYGIKQEQISGAPSWVESARYDIQAKVAGSDVTELRRLSMGGRESMLQPVLTDRFKLKVHRGQQVLRVYELVIAKKGPKLKEATPGDTYANGIKGPDGLSRAGMMWMIPGQLTGQAIPVSNLARLLSRQLNCTIVDKTGLTGKYDIKLQWNREESLGAMFAGPIGGNQEAAPPTDASGPSIFTALQEQLGLRLQSTKGPVETLVIDHIERPSEN
jgi:uncharacterized protein (TIGR03435 family)